MTGSRIKTNRVDRGRLAWASLGVAIFFALLFVGRPTAFAEDPPAEPAAAEPAATEEGTPLATGQRQVLDRFSELEKKLLRMAELTASTDPHRAALLRKAVAQSKQRGIETQLSQLVELLQQDRLAPALKNQASVEQDLVKLLELLLSEDRSKRLQSEKERIQKYIQRVNKLIKEQKQLQGEAAGDADLKQIAEQQGKLAEKTEELANDIAASDDGGKDKKKSDDGDQSGTEGTKRDKPKKKPSSKPKPSGKPADGKPGEGQPGEDKPGEDKPGENKPGDDKSGDDKSGDDKSGDDKSGDDKSGDDKSGDDKSGDDKSGDDKSGQDKPGADKPGEKESSEGKPAEESQPSDADAAPGGEGSPDGSDQPKKPGQKGKPGQGEPGEESENSTPGNEESEDEQAEQGEKNPVRERVAQAEQKMREAQKKLAESLRDNAVQKQEEAKRELELAKAELESILRQLREEEIGRTLAMLESRFRKMLEMQNQVNTATKRLDKVPVAERDRDDEIEAGRLSGQEARIVAEADKALAVLHDEGSAVAFPEAVSDLRDDMEQVVVRLAQAKVDTMTQGLEDDIVVALEEMIAAFHKAQKEAQAPKGGQSGGESESPLVDVLSEIKMIRSMQMWVNQRTKRYTELTKTEQAEAPDLIAALRKLSEREERIRRVTRDIVVGRNK